MNCLLFFILLSLSCIQPSWQLPDKEEFRVRGLEEVEPAYKTFKGNMYAGLLEMNNKNRQGKLMFWLFAPEHPTVKDSLVLWLNGGPGCTSFSGGNLFEMGPVVAAQNPAGECCVDPNGPLRSNDYAWTKATAVLFIEQPVGVGFSYGGPEPQNEDEVSGDVYAFLINFYHVFDEFADSKLAIFGESYAGIYAPSIAHRIHQENLKQKNHFKINLGYLALGNGWVDPRVQGPAAIDYAYWHGLIDSTTRDALHAEYVHCINSNEPDEPSPFHKFNTPDDCSLSTGALQAAGAGAFKGASGPNQYDVTTWDPYAIIAHGNTTLENFYNDPRVKKALHAPDDIWWRGCIEGAGRRRLLLERHLMLEQDQPVSTLPYIAEMLDADIPVLVYNGDRDLSCCAQGSEMLLDGMKWKGKNGWPTAPRGLWMTGSNVSGYSKEFRGLKFVVVYNSGHLVPFNQPVPALDLVTRFLQGQTFMDHDLPTFDFIKRDSSSTATPSASQDEVHGWHSVSVVMLIGTSFALGFAASSYRRRKRDEYEQVVELEEE